MLNVNEIMLPKDIDVKIIGSDINPGAIAAARTNIFSGNGMITKMKTHPQNDD